MEDNDKDNVKDKDEDNNNDKGISVLGLDRYLWFSRRHQRHRPHDEDDVQEEDNEVEDKENNKDKDNNKHKIDKGISALRLDRPGVFMRTSKALSSSLSVSSTLLSSS